jgi:hypothetical protein
MKKCRSQELRLDVEPESELEVDEVVFVVLAAFREEELDSTSFCSVFPDFDTFSSLIPRQPASIHNQNAKCVL